jgi:murein DD-endopeptidase MepM/ murein hydrolase activator NlpD
MRRFLAPLMLAALLLAPTSLVATADTTPSPSPSATSTPAPPSTPTLSPGATPALAAAATPTPSPTTSSTPAPAATPTPTPSSPAPAATTAPATAPASQPPAAVAPAVTDAAAQRLIDQARAEINLDLADALAEVQRLSDAMDQNATEQDQLQQRIEGSQARIDELDDEISQLDDQIGTTQDQITTEQGQIGVLARELYQQPSSLLLRVLQAGSLRDMVTETGDLTEAAFRANALKQKLTADLNQLQRDEAERQQAEQQQEQLQQQLNDAVSQLSDLSQKESDTSDQLQSAMDDGQAALDVPDPADPSLLRQAADMLRAQRLQLIGIAEQQVWQQAQLWATLNSGAIPPPRSTILSGSQPLPGGTQITPAGTVFAYPIQGAVLTQGFGPTTLAIEPPMFGFPHFHTGLDLASPNTRITAAADGVVAAVGSGNTGYGNYVVIAHGSGLVTLYGHLAVTMVKVGQKVNQGQQIGVEGSTGNSTGTHLHFEVRLNGTPVDPSPYLPSLRGA